MKLGLASDAAAVNLQPGMPTMVRRGRREHGVQVGCVPPGSDPHHICAVIGHRSGDRAAQRARTGCLPNGNGL